MGRIKLAMAWATAGLLTFLIGETLNKSSAAGEQIFCPHAAVSKEGNIQSIPPLQKPCLETKSLAPGSCRFNQSFLRNREADLKKEER